MRVRKRAGNPAPTEEIAGYRGLERIGHGGFSVVYRGHSERLNRTVAVKVLSADLRDEKSRVRFRRELEMAGRLAGQPDVVNVLDVGLARSGRPYLAMDYYPGGSLKDLLVRGGPLPVPRALHIGVRTARALATAHEAGVLHRDIKPENILLSADGEPALADFGIGRFADSAATGTSARTDALTIQHTAPEVLDGQRSTPASDVYSLGSTLYELLDGAPAFSREAGEGVAPMLLRILRDDPPEPRRSDLPPAVRDAIRRAMAKRPEDRYPSAAAFADDLAQLLDEYQPAALAPNDPEPARGGSGPALTVLRVDRLLAPDGTPRRGVRRGRRRLPAVLATAAVLLTAGTIAATHGLARRPPHRVSTALDGHQPAASAVSVSPAVTPASTAAAAPGNGASPVAGNSTGGRSMGGGSMGAGSSGGGQQRSPAGQHGLAAPSNLQVTATGASTIRLIWTDNSGGYAGFDVNNGDTGVSLAPGTASYTWGGLAPNTYMCFKVRARDPYTGAVTGYVPATSPYYVCATTPNAGSAPPAPSNLRVNPASSSAIRLTWTDNSGGSASFNINNGDRTVSVGPGTVQYTWGGLAPGTYMCFRIQSRDSAGNVSGYMPATSPYYVCTTTPG
jgi:eukaryotic-like serine/threonine-protein kinase